VKISADQALASDQKHIVYEKVYKSVTEVRPSVRKTTDPKKETEAEERDCVEDTVSKKGTGAGNG